MWHEVLYEGYLGNIGRGETSSPETLGFEFNEWGHSVFWWLKESKVLEIIASFMTEGQV